MSQKAVLSTTNVPPPSSSKLLDKTGYEMATHASESADWINVLFAQVRWPFFPSRIWRLILGCGRCFKGTETICSVREGKKARGNRWKRG